MDGVTAWNMSKKCTFGSTVFNYRVGCKELREGREGRMEERKRAEMGIRERERDERGEKELRAGEGEIKKKN